MLKAFSEESLSGVAALKMGLSSGDNSRFYRYFWEVDVGLINVDCRELRRRLNKRGLPDSLAWPLSRGVAYVKHEGVAKSIARALHGPQ